MIDINVKRDELIEFEKQVQIGGKTVVYINIDGTTRIRINIDKEAEIEWTI